MSTQPDQSSKKMSLFAIILLSGFLVGTLDITSACINTYIFFGKGPAFVLKFVATSFFGKSAFTGGTNIAVYGLLIHYAIAFTWTIFFFLIYPKISILAKNRVITGIAYGLFVWLVMNLIAVPLTLTPQGHFHFVQTTINIVILMVMIGMPLSFIAYRYYSKS
jgi:membrane protease YdiL (CAAX protease family)